MRLLLNIVWLVFGGFVLVIGYTLAGIICCVFVVTIPFGLAAFRIASFALWPFGRMVVEDPNAGVPSALANVIWLVFAGIWITIGHLVAGVAFCVSIIGIPVGLAHFKMVPISLMPLGKQIVAA